MMRSRRMRTAIIGGVLLVPVGFAVLVGGDGNLAAYWLIKLPRSRDARLVGTWQGIKHTTDGSKIRTVETVFQANGKGISSIDDVYRVSFDWGVEGGVLYTRRMATDAWSASSHPYTLSADRQTAGFKHIRMFDFVCADMKRK
ncbi:MAG: hypothetical protein P4L46_09195 [Fimbriimonas sp.]|nr:hypothetical protein [Fimbriimonas sp.]